MVANKVLRANARKQLGGGLFQNGWLMMLVACLIYEVVIALGGTVIFGSLLLTGPMTYGLARVATGLVKGKQAELNDLAKGFTEDVGQTILLGLMQTLYTFLWALLLIVPGIIKSYSYAMSYYLQQDRYNKDWRSCIDDSKEMMVGNKWRLFCLDMSFIGWYIVGAFCLCIGVLWVAPYHQVARANFYEALKAECGANKRQEIFETAEQERTERADGEENLSDDLFE